jgi:phytoene dehydrogenase-like protein
MLPVIDLPSKTNVVVVGSGPNGLAAAIAVAQAGYTPAIIEAAPEPGGGMRSAHLTLPGYIHDVCSAVHPLGRASPFFNALDLGRFGLSWADPPIALAHPFEDGSAALLERSVEVTSSTLTRKDSGAYRRLMAPLVAQWELLVDDLFAPPHFPRHAMAAARFRYYDLMPAGLLARLAFRGFRARGFFAGLCAHSQLPLSRLSPAGGGLLMALLGHAVGWPFLLGGSQRLADSLVALLRSAGGEIITRRRVTSLHEIPPVKMLFLNIPANQSILAGDAARCNPLSRIICGPGTFKIDWALDGPIPWKAAECLEAGTVHLGGTLEEIADAESQVARGLHPEKPFVILAQQSLFDSTRAPEGKQTAWAYCHVPHRSSRDMTHAIENQIERFAPGFREHIIARHTRTAAGFEAMSGKSGDPPAGLHSAGRLPRQSFAGLKRYRTGAQGVYVCSAFTPPGPGVHGMCGYYAAQEAIRQEEKKERPDERLGQ